MDAYYKAKGVLAEGDKGKKKCLICNKWFFYPKRGATCSDQCKKILKKRNENNWREKQIKIEAEKENLNIEAKRWINKKERKFTPRHSYEELNKRSEYSRVFGKYSEAPLYFQRKGFSR